MTSAEFGSKLKSVYYKEGDEMGAAKGSVFLWAEEERTFDKALDKDGPTFNVVFRKWLGDVTLDEVLAEVGEERNKAWQFRLRDPAESFPLAGKKPKPYPFSFLVGGRRMADEIVGLFVPKGVDLRKVATGLADFRYFGRSPKIVEENIDDYFLALLLNNA